MVKENKKFAFYVFYTGIGVVRDLEQHIVLSGVPLNDKGAATY